MNILLTGVASGIGKDIALKFILKGHDVYGIDIKKTDIKGLSFFQCDITNKEQL